MARKSGPVDGRNAAVPARFPGPMSTARFLREYWQKRPLLVRGAFPAFAEPLSPREVLRLACSPDAESRIVVRNGRHWSLEHGPFTGARLSRRPRRDWTVLVQDTNHFSDRAAALLARFAFVPHARVDDLMVSYAVPGGTVGPHVDSYDVFLIQGTGRRRWQVSRQGDLEFVPGLDLRILARFRAEEEWVLEPGDMLYLPPGIPHHGVALDPSLTLSVGFLAPSRLELQKSWIEFHLATTGGDSRYADPELKLPEHPGEIRADALDRVTEMLQTVPPDRERMGIWFGRFITMGKPGPQVEPAEPAWELAEWQETLRDVGGIRRNEIVRWAWLGDNLFVNGEAFPAPPGAAQAITAERVLTAEAAGRLDPQLLLELTNQGYLYFEEEE